VEDPWAGQALYIINFVVSVIDCFPDFLKMYKTFNFVSVTCTTTRGNVRVYRVYYVNTVATPPTDGYLWPVPYTAKMSRPSSFILTIYMQYTLYGYKAAMPPQL
jgi:hypothetical protein